MGGGLSGELTFKNTAERESVSDYVSDWLGRPEVAGSLSVMTTANLKGLSTCVLLLPLGVGY